MSRLILILAATLALFSVWAQGSSALGHITAWTQKSSANTTGQRFEFGCDGSDQLTSAIAKNASTSAVLSSSSYDYDDAGNRRQVGTGGTLRPTQYNAANQITTTGTGSASSVNRRGTLNTPSNVSVRNLTESTSHPAVGSADKKTFSASITVAAGTNTAEVTSVGIPSPGFNAKATFKHYQFQVDSSAAQTYQEYFSAT